MKKLLLVFLFMIILVSSVYATLLKDATADDKNWLGNAITNGMALDSGGWTKVSGVGGTGGQYNNVNPFDGVYKQEILGASASTRWRYAKTVHAEQCILYFNPDLADNTCLTFISFGSPLYAFGYYTDESTTKYVEYSGSYGVTAVDLPAGYDRIVMNVSDGNQMVFRANDTDHTLIKAYTGGGLIEVLWIDVDDALPCNSAFDSIVCGNYTDFLPVISPNSSSIDLLFKNSTSEYKTVFQESENFKVYLNYTDDLDNSALNDSNGNCNITTVNGIIEEIGTEDNFELCDDVLCSNKTYSFEATFHTNDSFFQDFIRVEICNAQTSLGFITANISCGVNTYSEIIAGVNIPLCNGNFGEFFINSSVCANHESVNVSITADVSYTRRKLINEIEIDREYLEHFNTALFNATNQLWYINHTHEYYAHGSKRIYANCSYSVDINFNNSVSENITIVNVFPFIPLNHQVNTSLGLTNISNNVIIEYASGVWNWLISITDDDLDKINYTIYNSSGSILASKVSSSPIIFNTSDGLFADFSNPFNLTVFANDTSNNITQGSILFNVTDTGNPTFTGFTNTTNELNTNYTFSGQGQDEYLWEFEFQCNNTDSFSFSTTGIGATTFNFVNNQTNISGDTLCNFNFSDGHTGELIDDFSLSSSSNSFTFNGITIQSEKTLKNVEFVKQYDKYKVCIETSEIESYLFLTMPNNCVKYPSTDYKGWYVCDDDYWVDFESQEDYPVWTDGNKIITVDIRTAKSKVICLDSIGVLNRVSGSQLITAVVTPIVAEQTISDRLGTTNSIFLFGLFLLVWVFLIILSSLSRNNMMLMISSLFGILIAIAFIRTFTSDTLFQNMMLIFIFINIMLMVMAGFRTGHNE